MFQRQYSDKDIETLVKMWEEGATAVEIGDVIGKSKYSVRQFMNRNREKYGFKKKGPGRPFLKNAFDKEWNGVISCGHWMKTES